MEIKKIVKIRKIIIKKIPWLKFTILFGFLIYCGYLWYAFIYINQLNDEEKKTYMATKEQEVVFNQDNFNNVLNKIEQRKTNYATSIENVPDIFRLRQ